ncbi:MAG: hypothetical protein J7L15_07660 [Clostridiales bacterium]|nr:hypothetical protein [Clostridiales bacterium]
MKVKLVEIKNAEEPLKKIVNKELNIRVAYKLAKLLKVFSSELVVIEEARIKLVRKFAEIDEDKIMKVPQEKTQEFMSEFIEFLQEEIDIDFEPIDISEIEDITFTASDMLKVEKFLKNKIEEY